MFGKTKYQKAVDAAFKAICISLEEAPDTWTNVSKTDATQGDVHINIRYNMYDNSIFDVTLTANNQTMDVKCPWKWKIKNALQGAEEFIILKQAMKSLGSCQAY